MTKTSERDVQLLSSASPREPLFPEQLKTSHSAARSLSHFD